MIFLATTSFLTTVFSTGFFIETAGFFIAFLTTFLAPFFTTAFLITVFFATAFFFMTLALFVEAFFVVVFLWI